jgi:glycosyltransferase involved in cell wall biosynthesis
MSSDTLLGDKPLLSIGMPIFNGEQFLEKTLDSILGQTYTNFELIISDNASTDRTQQKCRTYASTDSRISYYRNKRNIGAPANYNKVFKLSSGKYFKWAAHDDIISPEYLEKCVSVLEKDPSVVLCHSKTGRINEHGVLVGNYDHKMRIDSRKIQERFGDLIRVSDPCWPIFGVVRAGIFAKTPLHGNYGGADRNLLAEIGLYGRIYEIPEYLFFRRDHPQAYTRRYLNAQARAQKQGLETSVNGYREQMAWWGNVSWINFTDLKNCIEFFRSIRRVPLKWSERMLCYEQIFRWFFREGWRVIGGQVEIYFLRRSSFGRQLASVIKMILRRTVVSIIEKTSREKL